MPNVQEARCATAEKRARHIADLRAMADWLEAHPEIPIGPYPDAVIHFFVHADWTGSAEAAVAEIDRVNDLLGPASKTAEQRAADGRRHYGVDLQVTDTVHYNAFTIVPEESK